MTTIPQTPVLLEDSDLLRAATNPRDRLFPILNRASAFAPLIMVCCVLPAIQLLARPTLNEEGSLWGLRALAVADATNVQEFIQPGVNESIQPLLFQPPLASWLNGIVIRVLGPLHPLTPTLVSLVATGLAVWLTSRLAWRIGGPNTALVSAVLICSHPQTLQMAISPSNAGIGLCLILATVFGFQRHIEGKPVSVSRSLVVSGIAWGLSLLAVGPIALTLPLLFSLHALNYRVGNHPEFANPSFREQLAQSRPAFRSILIVVGIGLLIGGWWELMMVATHGLEGVQSWWFSVPIECLSSDVRDGRCSLQPLIHPRLSEWFRQQSLFIAWFIVGLERAWHILRRPSSELERRRYQLLMLWWLIAFVGRILTAFIGTTSVVNTAIWNLALLGPTVLLAASGIGTLIERAISRRGEFFLVVLLVSLTAARLAGSWLIGLAGGAVASTFLICGPLLAPSGGRTTRSWSHEGWRELLQCTLYGSLIICVLAGIGAPAPASDDAVRLAELRDRLRHLPEVRRISVVAISEPIPVTLRYLLRCRWPNADLVATEGWDMGLTAAMAAESENPTSRFLVLEWTRRDIKLSTSTNQAWEMITMGDPMRLHGRRLSIVLVQPRS